jgi:hypothetical protein
MVIVLISPLSMTNPAFAPGGLLTFRARVILTLITDCPMHLLLSAAREAASSMSSSEGDDASVQRTTCDPEHPEAWYHQCEPDRCSGERESASLSVACFPTYDVFGWMSSHA